MNIEKSVRIMNCKRELYNHRASFRLLRDSIVKDVDNLIGSFSKSEDITEKIVISIDLERNAFCYPVRERLKRPLSLESILGA